MTKILLSRSLILFLGCGGRRPSLLSHNKLILLCRLQPSWEAVWLCAADIVALLLLAVLALLPKGCLLRAQFKPVVTPNWGDHITRTIRAPKLGDKPAWRNMISRHSHFQLRQNRKLIFMNMLLNAILFLRSLCSRCNCSFVCGESSVVPKWC